jgi:two-component system nitrogen regulation sensor histidine kinase NtrY
MMNSLTPISSLSESLPQLLAAGGDASAAVATIARRSRHLMNFVERYRKIADLPPPQPRRIDLPSFLADIDALMQAHLAPRNIAYASSVAAKHVDADPDLLSQALINLLHNAADAAAHAPGPALSLACLEEDGEILFRVSDNGPGIAPDRVEEIFVPFFTTKEGGSGIGLTLARQIALAHGGRIALDHDHDGATRFTIALPQKARLEV